MHWADVIAKKVLEKHPEGNVVATGITPSGEIHVGNMREILTGDIITRALKDGGDEKANLIYIGDSFDPLRKVYPFLDPSYKQHVGKPLSEIPCPCTEHENYAEHFLEPFLESLKELGVEQKTLLTHKLYKEGRYAQGTKRVLENREKIRKILEKISGRELPRDW
ncbi:MAG TPA: lysine--tRNA ligase, partial [Thermoplasmata archaeon]|nr:lysine--tRNA ligase [Thermoplasmata archaeon]